MTLRRTLQSFTFPPPSQKINEPAVATMAHAISQQFQTSNVLLQQEDAQVLINRFRQALAEKTSEQLPAKDWRHVPWVAFVGEHPLSQQSDFLIHLFAYYRGKQRATWYRSLVWIYLQFFNKNDRSIALLAQELKGINAQLRWEWGPRHKKFDLFSPTLAPIALAKHCLQHPNTALDALAEIGIKDARITCGMASAAFLEALEAMPRSPMSAQDYSIWLDRILAWAMDGLQLRYPAHRSQLIEAMLLPWQRTQPPLELKEKITNRLLDYFHDPRMHFNAAHWLGVSEVALGIFRSWLTQIALEQFFTVVDEVAEAQAWQYRRAFWMAYYQQGYLREAWVVFGKQAMKIASQSLRGISDYGVLESGSGLSNHSVLLMRIGNLTIADWSHSGKCHIWRDGNPQAPQLYRESYSRSQLITGSDNQGQVHNNSSQGSWQEAVNQFIYHDTNIFLLRENYMLPKKGKRHV